MSLRTPRGTRSPRRGFTRANPINPHTLLLAGLGALARGHHQALQFGQNVGKQARIRFVPVKIRAAQWSREVEGSLRGITGQIAPLLARFGLATAKPAKAGPIRRTVSKRRTAVQSR